MKIVGVSLLLEAVADRCTHQECGAWPFYSKVMIQSLAGPKEQAAVWLSTKMTYLVYSTSYIVVPDGSAHVLMCLQVHAMLQLLVTDIAYHL